MIDLLGMMSAGLRAIPRGTRGKWRLARILLGRRVDRRDVQLPHAYGASLRVPSLREPVAFALLVDGIYEAEVLQVICGSIRPGTTFVDVGANIGAITAPVAVRLGLNCRVLAIEPSPTIFPYLSENIASNELQNVIAVNCAASDRSGLLNFYEAPVTHFGMGALAPQFGALPTRVATRTLDDLLAELGMPGVSVMKVDVEGWEYHVFRGAERLLSSPDRPLVVFEFNDWAEPRAEMATGTAQTYLRGLGFELWRLEDWLSSAPPLAETMTSGSAMLVAQRLDHPSPKSSAGDDPRSM